MQEPKYILGNGTPVCTCSRIDASSGGLFVATKYLEARCSNMKGTIKGWVGGHGGGAYWVQHDVNNKPNTEIESKFCTIAAYGWWEFDVEPKWAIVNEIMTE